MAQVSPPVSAACRKLRITFHDASKNCFPGPQLPRNQPHTPMPENFQFCVTLTTAHDFTLRLWGRVCLLLHRRLALDHHDSLRSEE